MPTPQQTLEALERAIHEFATSGIQSYTMPDGRSVSRYSLNALRAQADRLREKIALDDSAGTSGDPLASHVEFGDWS